VKTTRLFLYP